jgi:rubredoxin
LNNIPKIKLLLLKPPMKTYLCIVCGFIYDEASGRPEDGIAPGTLWDDVPTDWSCPDCGAGKDSFEMMAI